MKLMGMLDSPFVRRVAITMDFLGIPFEHMPLSIFQSYDEFRKINPMVKVPTLVLDDGEFLVDSSLIIDYLESISPDRSLVPTETDQKRKSLQILGATLVAMEKTVQLIYELKNRPAEAQYEPWIVRVQEQLISACQIMEKAATGARPWLTGSTITQADVTLAIAWRFIQHVFPERVDAAEFPQLVQFSLQAEELPEFKACPVG